MNVLVIPEDFRKDQYILKPILEAMFATLGKPRAKIQICQDPLLAGVSEALKQERLREVFERYVGMTDLFLLLIDRDGIAGRRAALDERERWASGEPLMGAGFFAENAWQELEVWLLAGHDLPKEWAWAEIRAHDNPKEAYFAPFAASRGVELAPGSGRKPLGREAAAHYDRIRQLCPEDVQALQHRLADWLRAKSACSP